MLLDAALGQEGLAVGRLLLLLDEVAEAAAAGRGDVDQARALEVVPLADLGALQRQRDPVEAEAAGAGDEQALKRSAGTSAGRDRQPTEVLMGS